MFVKRNADGRIIAVSEEKTAELDEVVDPQDPQLRLFLQKLDGYKDEMIETDLGFIRVLEDVIQLMIDKNMILFTELPEAARAKMLDRQQLRSRLANRLDLLDGEEEKAPYV